ncbi:MAG: PHB depolymerase family esterase [Rhodobacteraceae bacterium]|nr:PHB depolymerase family esterase [Paracoccaceae bacterium]
MNTPFARGMSRATELTQAGRLDEATALIQSLLNPGAALAAPAPTNDPDVLEGTFTRSGDSAPPAQTTPKARKGLKDTLRDIAAGGMPKQKLRAPVTPDLPHGAEFLSLAHAGPSGRREYRLYVPANRRARDMSLVVMLHGCTQTPEDFAIGTGMNALAEEFGCLIAYPAQPQGANAQKCWNWFRPQDQGKGRGEPAVIAGIVADIVQHYPADAARVYVAGLSAGGAAAAIMGAAYPEIFAAVGVHSGLPVGSAQDVASAFAAMRSGSQGRGARLSVPTIVFHGLADATVHPGNGAAVIAQALQSRSGLSIRTDQGRSAGRDYQQTRHIGTDGRSMAEHWEISGAGHAWAGGDVRGSYTDPSGPDASRAMLGFFLQHKTT